MILGVLSDSHKDRMCALPHILKEFQLRGVELVILDDAECIKLMEDFIAARPELWNEDIGE